MRHVFWAVVCLSLMGLTGCDSDRQEQHEVREQQGEISHTMRMYHLHILISLLLLQIPFFQFSLNLRFYVEPKVT